MWNNFRGFMELAGRLKKVLKISVRVDPDSPIALQVQQVSSLKSTDTRIYAAAAMTLGLKLEIFPRNPSRIAISDGSNRLMIKNARLGCNDSNAKNLAWDKFRTYKLLENNDITVPEHQRFRAQDFASAREMQEAILGSTHNGFPRVLKPVRGGRSRGVHVVYDYAELKSVLLGLPGSHETDLLLEQFIPGEHYRVFLCRNRIIDILHRKHASVTGDGNSTVQELVDRQNRERELFGVPLIPETLVADSAAMPPDTVLENGKVHQLSRLVDFKLGGTVFRVERESVHKENCELFEKISALSGLAFCCVDIIMPDISVTFRDQKYSMNEINHIPGQVLPYMADMARSNQCAEGILARYFSTPCQAQEFWSSVDVRDLA